MLTLRAAPESVPGRTDADNEVVSQRTKASLDRRSRRLRLA